MKYTISTKPLAEVAADALVVLIEGDKSFAKADNATIKAHLGAFLKEVAARKSRREWICTFDTRAGLKTHHVLFDSVDFGAPMPPDEKLKAAAARAVETCRAYSIRKIAFAVHHPAAALKAAALLEGAILGDFHDTRFKGGDNESRVPVELQFVVAPAQQRAVAKALAERRVVAEAVNRARLLVNAPSDVLTPAELAAEARAIARKHKLKATILNERDLLKQKYMPTYAVGKGAVQPPRMIVLSYRPRRVRTKLHIALVGKGMTFDTGGLCLKTREGMVPMIADMAGAAAVLAAMDAIAALELPVRVTAVVTSAHNAIGSRAFHPGDILRARNGKTIHIDNTDAEGRLILTDALHRAGEEGADIAIDIATLTAAIGLALGPAVAGVFTEDEELRGRLMSASAESGDSLWPMPLVAEYAPMLNHHSADISNIAVGETRGGAVHAANFLKMFVPKGVRWAHLDIAATAYSARKWRYLRPGGTGYGVRLLVETVKSMCG